jgi:hypothetical protein
MRWGQLSLSKVSIFQSNCIVGIRDLFGYDFYVGQHCIFISFINKFLFFATFLLSNEQVDFQNSSEYLFGSAVNNGKRKVGLNGIANTTSWYSPTTTSTVAHLDHNILFGAAAPHWFV